MHFYPSYTKYKVLKSYSRQSMWGSRTPYTIHTVCVYGICVQCLCRSSSAYRGPAGSTPPARESQPRVVRPRLCPVLAPGPRSRCSCTRVTCVHFTCCWIVFAQCTLNLPWSRPSFCCFSAHSLFLCCHDQASVPSSSPAFSRTFPSTASGGVASLC